MIRLDWTSQGINDVYDTFSFRIGYSSLFENTISEVYLDSFINTAIDTLGMTGFWMGFSFITILEFFTLFGIIIQSCTHKNKDNKNKLPRQSGVQRIDSSSDPERMIKH